MLETSTRISWNHDKYCSFPMLVTQKKGVQLGVCNVVVVVVGGGQLCCFYLLRKHTCFVIECECNSSCKVGQGNSQDCNQLCDIHWCVNWANNSPVHLEHSKQKSLIFITCLLGVIISSCNQINLGLC